MYVYILIPDPTPYAFGARLELRLPVRLGPINSGTWYIGILCIDSGILNGGAWF